MAKDVLITPLEGLIQFSSSAGTGSGQIKVDNDDLVISNLVGDILLGDGASDVFIGDGTNNVDIVFEQNGEIRDDGNGKTITIGSKTTTLILSSSSDLTLQGGGGNVGIGTSTATVPLQVAGDMSSSGNFNLTGDLSGSGNIKLTQTSDIILGPMSTFPTTNTTAIQWDFPSDDTFIYAQQSSSDVTYLVFEQRDNTTSDANVFWFNDYQGPTKDSFPLYMDGGKLVVNYIYDKRTVFARDGGATNGPSNNVDFYLLKSGSSTVSTANSVIHGDVSSPKVTIGGILDVTDTTDSSDATGDTGAVRIEGGVSIAKKLFVGTDLDVDGTANLDNVDIDGTVNIADDVTIAENKAIFFDSTDTFIKANTGTDEDLVISADEDIILAPDDNIQIEHGSTQYAEFMGDERELRITGNVSASGFISTDTHITASGNISASAGTGSFGEIKLPDDGRITFGASDDLKIYHDPNNSVIREDGGGDLFLQGSAIRIRENSDGGTIALFTDGAGTELRHDNVTKFQTSDGGINVTGHITASGDITASGTISMLTASIGSHGSIRRGTTVNSLKITSTNLEVGILETSGDVTVGGANLNIGSDDSVQWDLFSHSSGLLIRSASTQYLNITDEGNVQIGKSSTADSGEKLQVTGDISSSGGFFVSSSGRVMINSDNTGSMATPVGAFSINYGDATQITGSLTSDGIGYGDIVKFGGTTGMTAGRCVYLKSDGSWGDADATGGNAAAAMSSSLLGIAMGTNSDIDGVLLRGFIEPNYNTPQVVGQKVYILAHANGRLGGSTPSSAGNIVRVVGYALTGTNHDVIYFNPDNTWVEVS